MNPEQITQQSNTADQPLTMQEIGARKLYNDLLGILKRSNVTRGTVVDIPGVSQSGLAGYLNHNLPSEMTVVRLSSSAEEVDSMQRDNPGLIAMQGGPLDIGNIAKTDDVAAIVSASAMHWVTSDKHPEMLSQMYNLLQSGGVLRVLILGKDESTDLEKFAFADLMRKEGEYVELYNTNTLMSRAAMFEAPEYVKLLEEAGFTDVKIKVSPSFFQPKSKEDFFKHFLAIPGFLPDLMDQENESEVQTFLDDWLNLCMEKEVASQDQMGRYVVNYWPPRLDITAFKPAVRQNKYSTNNVGVV